MRLKPTNLLAGIKLFDLASCATTIPHEKKISRLHGRCLAEHFGDCKGLQTTEGYGGILCPAVGSCGRAHLNKTPLFLPCHPLPDRIHLLPRPTACAVFGIICGGPVRRRTFGGCSFMRLSVWPDFFSPFRCAPPSANRVGIYRRAPQLGHCSFLYRVYPASACGLSHHALLPRCRRDFRDVGEHYRGSSVGLAGSVCHRLLASEPISAEIGSDGSFVGRGIPSRRSSRPTICA